MQLPQSSVQDRESGSEVSRIAKLLLLDLVAACGLFILSAVVAALVNIMSNQKCYTCGARIGLTVFYITFFSLQPALWPRTPRRAKRVLAWCVGSVVGIATYFSLDVGAALLFTSGFGEGLWHRMTDTIDPRILAILLGMLSNMIALLAGAGVSAYMIQRYRISEGLFVGEPSVQEVPQVAGARRASEQERLRRLMQEGAISPEEYAAFGGTNEAKVNE